MIYKGLGNCGLRASVVGLGCEHLEGKDSHSVNQVVRAALDSGINILDVFMAEPNIRNDIGKALEGSRDKVILQGHICAIFKDGQ